MKLTINTLPTVCRYLRNTGRAHELHSSVFVYQRHSAPDSPHSEQVLILNPNRFRVSSLVSLVRGRAIVLYVFFECVDGFRKFSHFSFGIVEYVVDGFG